MNLLRNHPLDNFSMARPRETHLKKYKIQQQRDDNCVFGDALK